MSWPPSAEEFYLGDPGPRAIFQGDIYEDVPFTKAGAGNSIEAPPSLSASRRRHVAVLLHPCYIVGSDGATPVKAQPVAAVYEARSVGLAVPDDWEGVYGVCPLPDLAGDDEMWVADFRMITVVDRSYLREDRRLRCLSELGWAVFRQRYVTASTRGELAIEDLLEVGRVTWIESEMECAWRRAGRDLRDFRLWLDEEQSWAHTATRRDYLDRDPEIVWSSLRSELGE